jgi:hypothetical protein
LQFLDQDIKEHCFFFLLGVAENAPLNFGVGCISSPNKQEIERVISLLGAIYSHIGVEIIILALNYPSITFFLNLILIIYKNKKIKINLYYSILYEIKYNRRHFVPTIGYLE